MLQEWVTSKKKPGLFFIDRFFIFRKMSASLKPCCGTWLLLLLFVCFNLFGGSMFFLFLLSYIDWSQLNMCTWNVAVTLSLSWEAQVCILWTLEVPLFLRPVAFRVDTFLWEGMICLKIFRTWKLESFLIGYVDMTVFREIWSEHSVMEWFGTKACWRILLNIFFVVAANATD